MKVEKYKIRRWDEEDRCCFCGWPLDIDDIAYLVEDKDIYCSRVCIEFDHEVPDEEDIEEQGGNYPPRELLIGEPEDEREKGPYDGWIQPINMIRFGY